MDFNISAVGMRKACRIKNGCTIEVAVNKTSVLETIQYQIAERIA